MGLLTWGLSSLSDAGKMVYYGFREACKPSDDVVRVDRGMTPSKVIEGFTQLGFLDVTSCLNLEKCDEFPTKITSFGDVYQGALHDGTVISLKCLQPVFTLKETDYKQLEDAAREVYLWYKCKHPNILSLIGVAQFRGQLAMISPWMKHQNLEEFLSKHRSSQVDRLEIVTQIADGLAYLHRMGTVHGDIKGDNVLVSEDGVPKLTDFGTATLQEWSISLSSTTVGTDASIRWTAPELLLGEGAPTYMADVWALGMLVLETFTDAVPYAGLHDTVALTKIMNQVLPQRPEKELPPGNERADLLWELLNQCWAPDPRRRPTAVGIRDKMQEIMQCTR
ncbi:tyrosine kinase catalytic domain protein [Rhizoctonia solani AG-3 Rhs1AP]|uniref:Tyrosine kinase catalytic domain protein n=1 Tax=Rhizoctonia solani AG-3 Rhs1AP TaxID=1086054 RepID=X8J674_9AGAM|nr:tyrosine kinase catalytic domain protein [Rhizoctonia solani AG-3 Rhs1AP]